MATSFSKSKLFWYVALVGLALPATSVASSALPGCPDTCGNVSIPYPFGTRPDCYRPGFYVTCNESFTPPKPFLGENIDLLDINITSAEVRVLNYIGYHCYNQTSEVNVSTPSIDISALEAFLFSSRRNKFTVIGCYALAYINGAGDTSSSYASGCASFCESLNSTTIGDGSSCNGLGCCQTAIPMGLSYYEVEWGFNYTTAWSFNPCTYAALMQEDWYHFSVKDLSRFEFVESNKENVPIVLDWAIRENGTCLESHKESSTSPACQSNHSGCDNTTNGDGYICKCLPGYEGNPYLKNGGCTGNL
jgi:Wall-associated receptor kinase galacturonan-binding